MPSLTDNPRTFLGPVTSVTPGTVALFSPYYQSFATHRKWSRFYMGWLSLAQFPHHFGYCIVNDCLVILKRRLFGKRHIVYAVVPPMHIHGDLNVEKAVVKELLALGVDVRILDEDIPLLDLAGSKITADKNNVEFIYGAQQMRDGADKNLRYYAAQSRRAVTEGKATVRSVNHLSNAEVSDSERVTDAWKHAHSRLLSLHSFVRKFNDFADGNPTKFCASLLYDRAPENRRLVGYSVTTMHAPGMGSIDLRLTIHGDFAVKRPTQALHALDGMYWTEIQGPNAQLNIGSGVGIKGLTEAKKLLKPLHSAPMLTLRATKPQHEDLWTDTVITAGKVHTPRESSVLDLFT